MIRLVHVQRMDVLVFGPLLVAIVLLGAFVGTTALPDLVGLTDSPVPSSPKATPAPTSPMAGAPIGISMPPEANCSACHLDAGGVVGTRPIPALAHPLEGWTDCTACHAENRLVETAPGHSSLHKDDCLTCHSVPSAEAPAPPRPHHLVSGQACVSCHGSEAPLPTDMAGRNNCWLCHAGTEFSDLFREPAESDAPQDPSVEPALPSATP
jgi:hypothetical protein